MKTAILITASYVLGIMFLNGASHAAEVYVPPYNVDAVNRYLGSTDRPSVPPNGSVFVASDGSRKVVNNTVAFCMHHRTVKGCYNN